MKRVLEGLSVVKGVADLFKKKGRADSDRLRDAVAVVEEVVDNVAAHPVVEREAYQLLMAKEVEFDNQYTQRVAEAMQLMRVESASTDAWVRRARPLLMYVGYMVMCIQLIVFPLLGIRLTDFVDSQIIYWFYSMFGAGYLGYGVLRTVDKTSSIPTKLPELLSTIFARKS